MKSDTDLENFTKVAQKPNTVYTAKLERASNGCIACPANGNRSVNVPASDSHGAIVISVCKICEILHFRISLDVL